MALLSKPLTATLGDYGTGKADDNLADPAHLQSVRLRRRQLSRMTTAFDLPLAKARLPDAEFHISRKIDGEYTCLLFNRGEVITLNPGGTIRAGAPFHREAAKRLKAAGIKTAMLGGELHVRRDDGERTRIHDVVSRARNPKSDDDLNSLCFAVFNIYELDGDDLSMRYGHAMSMTQKLFDKGDRVFAVDTVIGDRKQVFKQFNEWVVKGDDEGVVVRSDSAGVFKIKPRHSLDLAVLGFSEGQDDRSGMLHSLLVGVVRDKSHAQVLARVGGGFTDEQRSSIFKKLSKQVVESDYAEVNSDRVAYRMIKPGMIVEISCLELIARTMHGSPIDRMIVEWDKAGERWQGVRRLPLCSVRSPQFVGIREDKKFSDNDAGIQRLQDIVEIPESSHGSLDALELPASKILKRSVATKIRKEATMVRKLLLWKTNKKEASRDYPEYVLHLTDYSPNRKEPLSHDICVSDSKEQILELFEQWQDEYFVGGWEVQGEAPKSKSKSKKKAKKKAKKKTKKGG